MAKKKKNPVEMFNRNHDGFGGDKPRYCRKCGKPIVWTNTDSKGRPNTTMKLQWEYRVCEDCLPKVMNKKNEGGPREKML